MAFFSIAYILISNTDITSYADVLEYSKSTFVKYLKNVYM